MSRALILGLLIAAAPLAACNDKTGTSFTVNTTDSDGNTTVSADGATGQVSLNVPGFSGKLNLPKMRLDGNDFDMNGVHLYPGSKITTMNIDAKGNDQGVVHVAFDSPADPKIVRDWFQQKLTAAGFKLHADGDGLAGTTDENKPFSMQLTPDGAGRAKGDLSVSG
ncbi:hypothetical protein EAH87_00825 [Sphingomonas koreensis]|nr:hypothetical protein EAH87_00825 [Sphingomonas koreensis]